MSVNIIAYPPGGGGNHVRNLCDLTGSFDDQWPWSWVQEQRVGLHPYNFPPTQPGVVHSLPGRNIHNVFIEHITTHNSGNYLLQGHFGELAPYAKEIRAWSQVQWLVLTMDDPEDRRLLRQRQQRLGYHPYWLDEEQIFLYRSEMYVQYFTAIAQNIRKLPVRDLWQRDITASGLLITLQQAFNLVIDKEMAKTLHTKWCDLNSI